MYCEARTSTGLGCDSLGLDQCQRCIDLGWKRYNEQVDTWYREGKLTPNYPVPAIRIEAWLDLYAWPNESIVVQVNEDESYTEVWPNDYRR